MGTPWASGKVTRWPWKRLALAKRPGSICSAIHAANQLRIREAYRRRDFGHMDLEVTLEDPKYYTRPFTVKTELNLISDGDALEFVCAENEKDRAHLATP